MYRNIILMALTLYCCSPWVGAETSASQPVPTAEIRRFTSPDEAAQALLQAAQSGDATQMAALFGTGHAALLASGDEVEDKNNREAFAAMGKNKLTLEKTAEGRMVMLVGQSGWPFPVPIVQRDGAWMFDAKQGMEEVVNRRIGRNELNAINVIKAYQQAQLEYANTDWDGDGVAEYAQKLGSEPGKHDGLFWETESGQPESPLGPLVANARSEGYKLNSDKNKPTPYHGYYYRILMRQGASAPGGSYNYVINGNMIAGFGLLAFPAEYGSSGLMSFIVNHQGIIFQKDLGPNTAKIASGIKAYNPDSSWQPVKTGE